MAREAAREMPGSPQSGVLVPGEPAAPRLSPGSAPERLPRLAQCAGGSAGLRRRRAGRRAGPGQRQPCRGPRTSGSRRRSRRPEPALPPSLPRAAEGRAAPGGRDRWQRPGAGAGLVSASPSRHFLSLFFRRCGTDRIIVPGNVTLCNHKICWQPGWEEGANYAIL